MEQNFSKIKKRIIQYAEYKGLSKRKIYLQTGIANGVLDKVTGLSESNIEKFISTYLEINIEWLLTGEGEMLENEKNSVTEKTEDYRELAEARKKMIEFLEKDNARLEGDLKQLEEDKRFFEEDYEEQIRELKKERDKAYGSMGTDVERKLKKH